MVQRLAAHPDAWGDWRMITSEPLREWPEHGTLPPDFGAYGEAWL